MSRRRKQSSTSAPTQGRNPNGTPVFDFNEIVKNVAAAQIATQHIPVLVQQELKKSWKQLPNTEAQRGPKSWFQDPLTLQYALGYKDRKYSLTYDTCRRIAGQLGIISAIINLRSAQVAGFCQPYSWTKSLGFAIRHKDPDHKMTPAEVSFVKELEDFIMRCGKAEKNPYARTERDDFETFIRKIVRDSLVLDQCVMEIVHDHVGLPFEFWAVDGATIRIAADDRYIGVNTSYHDRAGFKPSSLSRFANLYEGKQYGYEPTGGNPVAYVQVINGQIEHVYSSKELCFGVRNPRTDIYAQGYGYGEIEQLITIITAHLFAEDYNRKLFSQGTNAKGILNLKGDNYTPEQLEGLKRSWLANATGIENAHRSIIMQSEGIEWHDLQKSNQEMEFGKWMEYLLKVSSGVFLVDPSELNFEMHGGQQQTPLFEASQEWKLKASRDRGLKPLLKFLAKFINRGIIEKIDDHFAFEFIGLDELSENEKHEMLVEQLASYMTLNEARQSMSLPPLENGDIPMNPTYIQAMTAQQGQQGGGDSGGPPKPGGGKPPPAKYADNFAHDNQPAEGK